MTMDLSNDAMYRSFLKVLPNKALLSHQEDQYRRRLDEATQADAVKRLGIIQEEKHERRQRGQRC